MKAPLERGFYAQFAEACGVRILAHPDVSPAAIGEAARRVSALLGGAPLVARNLRVAGAELHVIGRDQRVTDLPMYRHLRGRPFDGARTIDERARGYGGLRACCAEEALLRLPSAAHADHRDVCAHEVAHIVLQYGLDARLRAAVERRFAASVGEGRWRGRYASTNAHEFFAELSMWWAGSHGDRGIDGPAPGRESLRSWDPESAALLDAIYGGGEVPALVVRRAARRTTATRSSRGRLPTALLFTSEHPEPVDLVWLAQDGREVPYAALGAFGAVHQPTWSGHVWVARGGGEELGRWVAGRAEAVVRLG